MDLETQALREAFAVAPASSIVLDTIEVSQPSESSIFLTNNYHEFTVDLEDSTPATFQAIPFKVALPNKSANELPTMEISIANPNQIVSNFLRTAMLNQRVVTVKYRPVLATSGVLSCQLSEPMTFHVGGLDLSNPTVVVAQCLFPNIANKAFPNENYTVRLFPGLRGW